MEFVILNFFSVETSFSFTAKCQLELQWYGAAQRIFMC